MACGVCKGQGWLAPTQPDCDMPSESDIGEYIVVERCDTCALFDDDSEAAREMSPKSESIECRGGSGYHMIVRLAKDPNMYMLIKLRGLL